MKQLGQPKIGQKVYARITRIEPDFAKAQILAICQEDGTSFLLRNTFAGIIFAKNVRSYDVEGIDLLQCFRPNDIIKAQVLTEQLGGRECSTMLSTVENDLGVVYARCESSGILLFPRSFTLSQCLISGQKEKRKNVQHNVPASSEDV